MKIYAAACSLDWLDSWGQYEDKMAFWVADATGQGRISWCYLHAVSERMEEVVALHLRLAAELYTPTGMRDHQDKQKMTRSERVNWDVIAGGPLKLFETALSRVGVLTCNDAEFATSNFP